MFRASLIRPASRFASLAGARKAGTFTQHASMSQHRSRWLFAGSLAAGAVAAGLWVSQDSQSPFLSQAQAEADHCKKKHPSPSGIPEHVRQLREQLAASAKDIPVEVAPLVFAPNVPPPIKRNHAAKIVVNMSTYAKNLPVTGNENPKYEFWTFDGAVPGPFIRARVGDVVEFNLTNKDSSGMQHNIDCHAVLGPGGGAPVLTADTDTTATGTFRMLHPGLFIYHCSVGPVAVHVANGMYGLMLVEPEEGLPPADKEFYVFQSDLYATPSSDDPKMLEMDFEAGMNENPSHVVFNGRQGSLIGENALQAEQGDRVRIFFGNGGPNKISSFHVIGGIFDKVYREGDLVSPPARSLQTTLVPAGGAVVVEMDAIVPGTYTLVDHALFRLEKGAVGFLNVNGPRVPEIYHSDQEPRPCEDCKIHP